MTKWVSLGGGGGAKFCEKTGFREGVRIINMSTIISEYLITGADPPLP